MHEDALVLPLDGVDLPADAALALLGGKGASLVRLTAEGLPVPSGFVVTTRAYRDFVRGGLDREILTELSKEDCSSDGVAEAIADAFARRELPEATAAAIRESYAGIAAPVAVRSSSTAEDLPELSFAGQHDTYLNVMDAEAVLDAVKRCWASLWTARVIDYRARNGILTESVALAVVVQRLVPAEASGVMFTANPVTGARDELVINASRGLGDALVGGSVTPDTYTLAHGRQAELLQVVNGKQPLLDKESVAELADLGERIQDLYGLPVDVEWTVHDGRFWIVQARPVTGLAPEGWNDSLAGDYLWTCANLGEGVPSVMTPATWSLARALATPPVGGHATTGNIGGRFYLNLSVFVGLGSALGLGGVMRRGIEQAFGGLPEGITVPPLPMSRPALLRAAIASVLPFLRQAVVYRMRVPRLLAETPDVCRSLRARIRAADSTHTLRELWRSDVDPLLRETSRALDAAAGASPLGLGRLHRELRDLVGEADATALLTGLHAEGEELVSLGPVLGLAALRRGEITRDTYLDIWGHRGADEFEISAPRPAESPEWLDRQLALSDDHDPGELLRRQARAREEAWHRLRTAHPRTAGRFRGRLDRAARAARLRERIRSEFVRTFWVYREFVLRAGELTGHGEDLFFLPIEKIPVVLGGDERLLAAVPAHRAAYQRYRALPRYPTVIRGRFDPVAWAADPNRRADLYDETTEHAPMGSEISGFPGAAGVIEGTARVISTVDEGESLRVGEILVTTVTNIGWTPLFPRTAAVVTDIGAPLSHAAIVARELGIPAVVGCRNATTRLSTGDRVRVDGTRGTVTLLDSD